MLEIVEEIGSPARLKVIGVGGGGSNAVNRMIEAGLRDVEFWVTNTDLQALEKSPCGNRVQIGRSTTRGLGAGGDPEVGRASAEEDLASIEKVVAGADMLFITAGMGGGTGTGAAPVIARVARDLGILSVAIVTKPFAFEGKKKMVRAHRGLDALSEHVDTVIAIPNQKLMHIVDPGTSFSDALLLADEVLFQATRGISALIMGHGIINLDFADVRTVMRNRGNALLGAGTATGPDRAVEAAQAAVSSPLLEEVAIEGAEALLVNVQGGPSMTFHEAAEAAQYIADRVGDEADVFWGAVIEPSLADEMRVTIVATGFPGARRFAEPALPAAVASELRPSRSLTREERLEREMTPRERVFPERRPAADSGRKTERVQREPEPAEVRGRNGGTRGRESATSRLVSEAISDVAVPVPAGAFEETALVAEAESALRAPRGDNGDTRSYPEELEQVGAYEARPGGWEARPAEPVRRLPGMDEGIRGVRVPEVPRRRDAWEREGGSPNRNALDVPTFIRKPVDE